MAAGFPACSCFVLFYFFILLIAIIDPDSFYYFDARSSLNYSICLSEPRLCIYTIAWFSAISTSATNILIFTFMQSISYIALQHRDSIKYQTVFILDECSGLINLTHQLHYKLNVALIFKLYPFICFVSF